MTRTILIAALAAVSVAAFAPQAMAQFRNGSETFGSAGAARTTTVKSSKSNTSDRVGGTQKSDNVTRTTTVKSSKSNTSDRVGGAKGTGSTAPAEAVNLNSSRSTAI
jgi:hypothetical protein